MRRRRGRWVLDYRDHLGVRRWETFAAREEADAHLARVLSETRDQAAPVDVPRDSTLDQYSERWLNVVRGTLKPSTHAGYERLLRRDVLPILGTLKVRKLRRGPIKDLLAERLRAGLAPDSVRLIHAVLRAVLNGAVDDELIRANPAEGLGRTLRLVRSKETRREEIKAFTREQLEQLLDAAQLEDTALYPLLLTLARTGMRIGEARALRWEDVDLEHRQIRIERAMSGDAVATPKSGHGRTVDMSAALVGVLRARSLQRGAVPWVFPSSTGTVLDHHNIAKRFRRLLVDAGLPIHFHLHCMRHTFASLLLAAGVSPAYVQEQLGHASIELTVGTYGRWLRKRAPGAVDALDASATAPLAAVAGSAVANQGGIGSSESPAGAAGLVEVAAGYAFGLVTREGLEPSTQRLRVVPGISVSVAQSLQVPVQIGCEDDGEWDETR